MWIEGWVTEIEVDSDDKNVPEAKAWSIVETRR
jgi:hypothetical protein